MSKDEAIKLYWAIWENYKHLQPEIRYIGNGEHIVYLAAIEYFVWSMNDWRKYIATPT